MPLHPTPTQIAARAREVLDEYHHSVEINALYSRGDLAHNLSRTTNALEAMLEGLYRCYRNLGEDTDGAKSARELFGPMTHLPDPAGWIAQLIAEQRAEAEREANIPNAHDTPILHPSPSQVAAASRAAATQVADILAPKAEASEINRASLMRLLHPEYELMPPLAQDEMDAHLDREIARIVEGFKPATTEAPDSPIPNTHEIPPLKIVVGPNDLDAHDVRRTVLSRIAEIPGPKPEPGPTLGERLNLNIKLNPEKHSNRRIEAAIQNAEKYIAQHDSDIAPGVGSYEVGIMRQLIDALMKTDRGADTAAENSPRERSALDYEALAQLRQEVLATIHDPDQVGGPRHAWVAINTGVLERTLMLVDTLLDHAHHNIATRANECAAEPTLVDGEWMPPTDPHITEPPC